jgi:hypothetical protein
MKPQKHGLKRIPLASALTIPIHLSKKKKKNSNSKKK